MGIKLLLAEDDTAFAGTLAGEMRALGHDVTIVADGRSALAAVNAEQFGAIVADRMIERGKGVSFVETLRAQGMAIPIVILTTRSSASDAIEALDAGADDYVTRSIAAVELGARLNAIIRGRGLHAAGGDTIRVGDIVVSPAAFRAWRDGRPLALARLEFDLLAELARHADRVLTRAMLIERVWGCEVEPGTNIVDVYIRRLRLKLTEWGGDDPIVTVRGVGYGMRR